MLTLEPHRATTPFRKSLTRKLTVLYGKKVKTGVETPHPEGDEATLRARATPSVTYPTKREASSWVTIQLVAPKRMGGKPPPQGRLVSVVEDNTCQRMDYKPCKSSVSLNQPSKCTLCCNTSPGSFVMKPSVVAPVRLILHVVLLTMH